MYDERVLAEHDGTTLWLTLNRPDKRNALDAATLEDLHTHLDSSRHDDRTTCVALTGAGGSFSAGYDLVEEARSDVTDAARWYERLEEYVALTTSIAEFPKPVVALVRGWCLAGGFELAMAADLVYATPDATFGEPEIRHGSGPVTMVMPFVVGWRKAAELLLTGDLVDAETALGSGMLTAVIADEEIDAHVAGVCAHLATIPLTSLQFTKRALVASRRASGAHTAFDANLGLHAALNGSPTEEQRHFNDLVRTEGLRAALAWRNARYADNGT